MTSIVCIFFFLYYKTQWLPATFKLLFFGFVCRIKKCIQVWNHTKVGKWWRGSNCPFKWKTQNWNTHIKSMFKHSEFYSGWNEIHLISGTTIAKHTPRYFTQQPLSSVRNSFNWCFWMNNLFVHGIKHNWLCCMSKGQTYCNYVFIFSTWGYLVNLFTFQNVMCFHPNTTQTWDLVNICIFASQQWWSKYTDQVLE